MNQSSPRDYSLIAPYYDKFFHKPLSQGHQTIGSLLRKMSRTRKNLKVLEIGVGSGLSFTHLPAQVDYTGVDVNEEMISMAREKAERLRKRKISLSLMDAKKLSFASHSFDLVVASSVLSAMDEPMKGMSEMIRVTKKGGRIAVVANIRTDSARSDVVKMFDPLTRKFLGFRLDLTLEDFHRFRNIRLIEQKQVNRLLGMPLSTYLLFEKV